MGKEQYPNTGGLYITADGGGSNGSRCKLFKVELQNLADELRIPIEALHNTPENTRTYKLNVNLTISALKQNVISLLLCDTSAERSAILSKETGITLNRSLQPAQIQGIIERNPFFVFF